MSEDDYGFFCDLENAKTMEYDKVEYYVVTTRTHYEVRRKLVGNRPANTQPMEIQRIDEPSFISTSSPKKSFFQIITSLPREVYYSLMVCSTTASCVYLMMTCI